jgi:hypothetical protein
VSSVSAVKNKDIDTDTAVSETSEALSRISLHALSLFQHYNKPLDITSDRRLFLKTVGVTQEFMRYIKHFVTEIDIDVVLNNCGQDQAPVPTGLTIQHLHIVNITKLDCPLFNSILATVKIPKS